ncbi:hypothetical protein [Streptomyces palmae]|uniref:Sensor domain-containing protein n=1 Tax=Streptomyces palmae TaxID=1701085 RepID=A0A4Z0HF46_9ACTN|nr:hypothetical protein [Streptomyces palmae]TGB14987.1 hypothetical protein E4099_07490 [Streptomyces palmae]
MRTALRAGLAGHSVVLAALLLTGCGGTQDSPDPGRPAASGHPSDTPVTAPGVDGDSDPGRLFTERELKAALPPAKVLGGQAEVTEVSTGLFGRYGGGDWSQCGPAADLRRELSGFQAASAQQTVRLAGAGEDRPTATVQLVSMPAARAERYLEVRRRLHEVCPQVTVDTEAAPVQEHHEAQEVTALGDEALLEVSRLTGGDEYDGAPSYTVDVRVGGVLAIVSPEGDRQTGISLAARTAAHLRTELYAPDGSTGS